MKRKLATAALLLAGFVPAACYEEAEPAEEGVGAEKTGVVGEESVYEEQVELGETELGEEGVGETELGEEGLYE